MSMVTCRTCGKGLPRSEARRVGGALAGWKHRDCPQPDLMKELEESLSTIPPRPFKGRDHCQRLWRDCGDDSPWYEKALFHALSALEMGDNPSYALAKIEKALAERPSEVPARALPRTEAAICGRLLVGQGGDTYDPTCVLLAGHDDVCKPETEAPDA